MLWAASRACPVYIYIRMCTVRFGKCVNLSSGPERKSIAVAVLSHGRPALARPGYPPPLGAVNVTEIRPNHVPTHENKRCSEFLKVYSLKSPTSQHSVKYTF